MKGYLAIVAGETNVGKSILCGDIAIANASNLCHWNEPVNDRTKDVPVCRRGND